MKRNAYVFSFIVITVMSFLSYSLIMKVEEHANRERDLLTTTLANEAKTLFNVIVITRKWNAQYEGVYVQDSNLTPNPYLVNNTLLTADGAKLVKINPAWMTRQISELASKNTQYEYRITSLHPLNPDNQADEFETKALKSFEQQEGDLEYFDKNIDLNKASHFNYMGGLRTTEECFKCHVEQGYKIGTVRGGIRVSIPLETYKKSLEQINIHNNDTKQAIVGISIFLTLILLVVILLIHRYQERTRILNITLSKKVVERTQELYELNNLLNDFNEHLEERVKSELEKNKEKEQLLLAQSKNAAMGEMISLIAHQWRQPLSVISMTSNNIMADIALEEIDPKMLQQDTQAILDQTMHMSKTIDDFSNFFKPDRPKECVDINEVCDDAIEMLGKVISNYELDIHVQYGDINSIMLYKRELLHVVVNLIKNAIDAYNDQKMRERPLWIETNQNDSTINISVSDKAGGIKNENHERIFEPYFSTKKEKNGTGLGLYITKMILENHMNGTIQALEIEQGTKFIISIPNTGHCEVVHD